MSANSEIEWTDHTFNVWWGCARVSSGCRNCYADTLASRWGQELWRRHGPRRPMSEGYWRQPMRWNKTGPARVFCGSMCDLFEDHPEPDVRAMQDRERARLWDLIEATPNLTWQLLTKRPENITRMVPWGDQWPARVWAGTSVEDQRNADVRVPTLLRVPAAVRFLSCEPLISAVDLTGSGTRQTYWLTGRPGWGSEGTTATGLTMQPLEIGPRISWVIAGGESGPGARPIDLDWVRSLRDQCTQAGTSFLFKQVGGRTPKAGGRELDGRTWDEYPVEMVRS